jgi:hypothetical protein
MRRAPARPEMHREEVLMDDDRTQPEHEDTIPLPGREVLSLIGSGSSLGLPGMDGTTPTGTEGTTAAPTADSAAGMTSQAGQTANDLVSADASSSGQESIISEDRSETISSSDSAYSET